MRSLSGLKLPLLVVFLVFSVAALAYAQGGAATTSISGVVADTSGAVIPGADVTIKNNGTGAVFTAVSGANGGFMVPALNPGIYTVTVALMGFKTFVVNNVTLNAAAPANVRVTLEVGTLEETVVVQGGAEIVQTTATAVATTMNVKQLTNLPLNSRSALDFMAFLPGVDTASTVRNSTVNGLPQSAINITIDGMNVQDNYLKSSDGFFARVTPRLDAVEDVTFTSAAQGADSGGQGAVQIRFSTRSGTNRYQGSGYFYFRDDQFNSNTWFNKRDNLPTPVVLLKQPGFRLGGPISIPKLFDGRNKAFFFFNYEWLNQPTTLIRNRVVLTTAAQQGLFSYGTAAPVNLLQLAAANGQLATVDPVVAKLLSDIRASTATTGTFTSLANPSIQTYTWQPKQVGQNKYPTVRLDFNLTDSHRLTFSSNYQHILANPDGATNAREPRFPGFPAWGIQDSARYTWQTAVRSTLGRSLVNEVRVGGSGGATQFNPNYSTSMWSAGSVANTNGYQLNINGAMGLTNAASSTTPSGREASTKVFEDTLNWAKGNHNFSFGGSFTRVDLWLFNQTLVPTVNFGLATGDPALGMFTTANFPGAATADLTNAQNLYAVLTGRITSIARDARIDPSSDKYVVLGGSKAQGRMHDMGFYAQDSWKLRKNLTLNLGVRYELQLPFYPINSSYSTATIADIWGTTGVGADFKPSTLVTNLGNLFKPGPPQAAVSTYKQFVKGSKAYNTDLNNIAPNVGVAWTPGERSGFLGRLIGKDGDTVLRAGYTTAYQRNGMADFSDVFGANPGILTDATRNQSLGNLGTVPLLFRDSTLLGAPTVPESRVYPMLPPTVTGSVNIFDPNLQVPYAKTWSFGVQRAISRNTAIEVRYTGAHNYAGWTAYNYNELNIIENGFLSEFKAAQANLQANIAAGRGSTFKYFGAGTGTSPLPIYLAFFSGVPASQSGDAARYTSTNFASSNYYNALAMRNPNPFTPAGTSTANGLMGSATFRANALTAGLPANFFLANPDMLGGNGASITGNGGYTEYTGITVEVRRRLSQGLAFQASYTNGVSYGSTRFSFRKERVPIRQTGTLGGVEHAVKLNWTYELPFGRGRKWANAANPVLDRIVGGWTFFGTGRVQSGRLLDFGNVRMVGFTEKDLQGMFELRVAPDSAGLRRVWMLPQDVIDQTVKAFNVSATSADGYGALGAPSGRYFAPANALDCIETVPGYGDCGARSVLGRGPVVSRFDFSLSKQVAIVGRFNFEFQAQVFNVFNRVAFTPLSGFNTNSNPGLSSSTASTFEVTGLADGAREFQFVFRINF